MRYIARLRCGHLPFYWDRSVTTAVCVCGRVKLVVAGGWTVSTSTSTDEIMASFTVYAVNDETEFRQAAASAAAPAAAASAPWSLLAAIRR